MTEEDQEKLRLTEQFFDRVSRIDPPEAVRLLAFFRDKAGEQGIRPQVRLSGERKKDPFVTPPGAVGAFGKSAGK